MANVCRGNAVASILLPTPQISYTPWQELSLPNSPAFVISSNCLCARKPSARVLYNLSQGGRSAVNRKLVSRGSSLELPRFSDALNTANVAQQVSTGGRPPAKKKTLKSTLKVIPSGNVLLRKAREVTACSSFRGSASNLNSADSREFEKVGFVNHVALSERDESRLPLSEFIEGGPVSPGVIKGDRTFFSEGCNRSEDGSQVGTEDGRSFNRAQAHDLQTQSSQSAESENGTLKENPRLEAFEMDLNAEVGPGSSSANQKVVPDSDEIQERVFSSNAPGSYEGSPITDRGSDREIQIGQERRENGAWDLETIQEGVSSAKEIRFGKITEEVQARTAASELRGVVEGLAYNSLRSSTEAGSDIFEEKIDFLNGMKDGLSSAAETFSKWGERTGVDKILARDLEVIQERLTSFKKGIQQVLRMRGLEDSSALLEPSVPWPRPVYRGLSGKEIFLADRDAVREYVKYMRSLLNVWRIPLQLPYNRDAVASYFNHRPHLLVFRFLEVSAAYTGVALWQFFYKRNFSRGSSPSATEDENEEYAVKYAETLKRTLVKLGPTFIKVAQSLSARPDFIGPSTAKVLSELQDRLPPFPNDDAMDIIEEELGVPVTKVFSHLSQDPVAAASFGQVYKGYTVEGEEVAVKVQRPDLLFNVARDIYILRLGLQLIRDVVKTNSDVALWADELGRGVFGELDYTLEAANAKEFESVHRHLSYVKVPRTLLHLTRKRVLTMEWIHGNRPSDLQLTANGIANDGGPASMNQRQDAKRCLDALVRKGVECTLVQLLETGVMHADPHPGNLLYTREDKLVYLDFGVLAHVTKKHQSAMLAIIAHLVNGEWQCLAKDFGELDVLKPSTDLFALCLALERAFGEGPNPLVHDGVPDLQFGQLMGKILKIAFKFRFRLPPYYTLVLRSLASLEGIAVSVDPDYKTFAAAYPFVIRRILNDNSRPSREVLQSLILNQNREFRWDRIAAIMSTSQKAAEESLLSGTAEQQMENMESSQFKEVPAKNDLSSWLLSFILSKEGASLRRVLFEADTNSLAEAFVAAPAASFRRKGALLLAEAFYRSSLMLTNLEPKGSSNLVPPGSGTVVSSLNTMQESSSDTEVLPGTISQVNRNLSQIAMETRMRNQRLWFILRVLMSRLRGSPILLVRTGWALVSMLGFAIAVTLHRYAVTMSYQLLSSQSRTPLKRISRAMS